MVGTSILTVVQFGQELEGSKSPVCDCKIISWGGDQMVVMPDII